MTTLPAPRQPSQPFNQGQEGISNVTPVLALKELVARLHREQSQVQDLLSSLSFALRSFNNLNQFLELIPLITSRVTDADAAAVVLFKPNGQVRLEQLHCHDADLCQRIRKAFKLVPHQSASLMPTAKRLNSSFNLDKQLSHPLEPDIQCFGTAILVRSTELGRLYVFSHNPEYVWSDTRQKLAQLVADQTAVAIENDELTVELRKKERLDRELEIGAEIQLRLLPRQCPQIRGLELAARCQTANRVGGDYYDFIPIHYDQLSHGKKAASESGRWCLTIGDVMGKGVPAGLIMTMTRGMLRAEVLNQHSPARILQHLNRVMYTDLENSNRFVTLFYSEYDPQTQVLSYSNAAHNPPFLWRAATASLKRLDTLGMLIGLDAEAHYQEAQIQLQPGDTLIYYTDGFTDAANQSGDRFEEENLAKAFLWACHHCQGPQAILEHLFEQVRRFVGHSNQNGDDMTLIVLQVKKS